MTSPHKQQPRNHYYHPTNDDAMFQVARLSEERNYPTPAEVRRVTGYNPKPASLRTEDTHPKFTTTTLTARRRVADDGEEQPTRRSGGTSKHSDNNNNSHNRQRRTEPTTTTTPLHKESRPKHSTTGTLATEDSDSWVPPAVVQIDTNEDMTSSLSLGDPYLEKVEQDLAHDIDPVLAKQKLRRKRVQMASAVVGTALGVAVAGPVGVLAGAGGYAAAKAVGRYQKRKQAAEHALQEEDEAAAQDEEDLNLKPETNIEPDNPQYAHLWEPSEANLNFEFSRMGFSSVSVNNPNNNSVNKAIPPPRKELTRIPNKRTATARLQRTPSTHIPEEPAYDSDDDSASNIPPDNPSVANLWKESASEINPSNPSFAELWEASASEDEDDHTKEEDEDEEDVDNRQDDDESESSTYSYDC